MGDGDWMMSEVSDYRGRARGLAAEGGRGWQEQEQSAGYHGI